MGKICVVMLNKPYDARWQIITHFYFLLSANIFRFMFVLKWNKTTYIKAEK